MPEPAVLLLADRMVEALEASAPTMDSG